MDKYDLKNETMWEIKQGDAIEVLKTIPDQSINTCVTSPPYWGLRDYGIDGQLGLEPTPEEYVANLVEVFREVKRVLRNDGTLWLNLGDSYYNYRPGKGQALVKQTVSKTKQDLPDTCPRRGNKLVGLKEKDLVGIPWMVAFALRADGWYLRSDIIWHKPNPMPESVTDRPTKAHEYIFLLSKSPKYYYDYEAIKEPVTSKQSPQAVSFKRKGSKREQPIPGQAYGTHRPNRKDTPLRPTRNKRSVWTVPTQPFPEAHFAVYPPALITPCILAGTSPQACPTCGAPWERVVERIAGASKECPKTQAAHEARGGTGKPSGTVGKSGGGRIDSISRTIGWQPTCSCSDNDGSGRCVVLDPFAGSGTTLLVATQHHRKSIGIELNPEYIEIAKRRLNSVQLKLVME